LYRYTAVFAGQLLLYLGLERVSVGNTVVLGQLVPVVGLYKFNPVYP
jgi:drug/metabolite transporter (DMT)-like permease